MDIIFKNSTTGEIKPIKFGWSWTIFFSAWPGGILLGIPLCILLCRRKLYIWGIISFFITLAFLALSKNSFVDPILRLILWAIFFCITIFLAATGNKMTAIKHLKSGWFITDTDNDFVKMAMGKWGVSQ